MSGRGPKVGERHHHMHAIEVHDLTRRFRRAVALSGITFTVAPGEVFGFLGPNGAGKTTTIRILTGQLRPTSGRASVAGCDVVRDRDQLMPRIGVVFERQNLYARLTARDNLAFAARLYDAPPSRIDEVLERVGLQARADDRIAMFSNGMRQRLMIARAVLHDPSVLFLDEPTRGLDPVMARGVRRLVSSLAEDGVTVFLTTHYMEEADALSDRVAILDRGAIVTLDRPEHLRAAHGGHDTTLEDVFVAVTGKELYT